MAMNNNTMFKILHSLLNGDTPIVPEKEFKRNNRHSPNTVVPVEFFNDNGSDLRIDAARDILGEYRFAKFREVRGLWAMVDDIRVVGVVGYHHVYMDDRMGYTADAINTAEANLPSHCVVPIIRKHTVTADGFIVFNFLMMPKDVDTSDIRKVYAKLFKKTFGFAAAKKTVEQLGKTAAYMKSPIVASDNPNTKRHSRTLKVLIIDNKLFTHKIFPDGCLFRQIGNSLVITQVRGTSNKGHMLKGTVMPITLPDLQAMLVKGTDKNTINLIAKEFEAGNYIGTADTLKGATPRASKYKVKAYWHEDSTSTSFFDIGKGVFEQLVRRIKLEGDFHKVLTKQAKEYMTAVQTPQTYAKYILDRYEEMGGVDEEIISAQRHVDTLNLIAAGIPLSMIAFGNEALVEATPKTIKRIMRINYGCKKYVEKDKKTRKITKVNFSFDKHHGIYLNAYAAPRAHGDYEIGLPSWAYDTLVEICKANGVTFEDLCILGRRSPMLSTSVQNVKLVRREDKIPVLTIGSLLASLLGADFDGDKIQVTMCLKSFMQVTPVDFSVTNGFDTLNKRIKKYFHYESTDTLPSDKEHVRAYLGLDNSERIGDIDGISETIRWIERDLDEAQMDSITSTMHSGPIQDIIEGKKWNVENLVSIEESRSNVSSRIYSIGHAIFWKRHGKYERGNKVHENLLDEIITNIVKPPVFFRYLRGREESRIGIGQYLLDFVNAARNTTMRSGINNYWKYHNKIAHTIVSEFNKLDFDAMRESYTTINDDTLTDLQDLGAGIWRFITTKHGDNKVITNILEALGFNMQWRKRGAGTRAVVFNSTLQTSATNYAAKKISAKDVKDMYERMYNIMIGQPSENVINRIHTIFTDEREFQLAMHYLPSAFAAGLLACAFSQAGYNNRMTVNILRHVPRSLTVALLEAINI